MISEHQKYHKKPAHMTLRLRISIMHFYPILTLGDIETMIISLKKIKVMQYFHENGLEEHGRYQL
jgi:hypothetical protein